MADYITFENWPTMSFEEIEQIINDKEIWTVKTIDGLFPNINKRKIVGKFGLTFNQYRYMKVKHGLVKGRTS